jgi:hypothetical protein
MARVLKRCFKFFVLEVLTRATVSGIITLFSRNLKLYIHVKLLQCFP